MWRHSGNAVSLVLLYLHLHKVHQLQLLHLRTHLHPELLLYPIPQSGHQDLLVLLSHWHLHSLLPAVVPLVFASLSWVFLEQQLSELHIHSLPSQ